MHTSDGMCFVPSSSSKLLAICVSNIAGDQLWERQRGLRSLTLRHQIIERDARGSCYRAIGVCVFPLAAVENLVRER